MEEGDTLSPSGLRCARLKSEQPLSLSLALTLVRPCPAVLDKALGAAARGEFTFQITKEGSREPAYEAAAPC